MLLSQTIPNLIGGVSQMPPALRLPSQGEICDNAFPSPTDGLTKRPPTQHIATIWAGITPAVDPLVHWINRDGVERYVVLVQSQFITVNDISTGNTHLVTWNNHPTDAPYLTPVNTPRKDFRALTIGDTTFLVNTTKTPAMVSSSGYTQTTCPNTETVVWVKQATNGATYAININNALAGNFTAPATGAVSTAAAAQGLATSMIGNGFTGANGWNILVNGSFISISRNSGVTFTCEALDSLGGTGTGVIQHNSSVQQFSDLPSYAYHGMIQKVNPNPADNTDTAYYLQFFQSTWTGAPPTTLVPGPGTWQEVPAPGVLTQIDPTTMPLQMQRMVDQTGAITGIVGGIYFNVSEVSWNLRTAGDDTTNSAPTFIGNNINDVFFYQNRLGFLAGTNVIHSESGNFTNFWRTTVLNLVDSDPIDTAAADPRVVKLRWAVPWQQQLIVFGDLKQFLVSGNGNPITPSNISITALTDYESNVYCKPIPVQNLLYFPFDLNGYVGLREFYVEYYTQKHVGRAVTDAVPKYIPGNPIQVQSCNSADLLAVIADGDPGSIFIYKWLWQGNTLYSADKLQSAWVRWNWDQPNTTTQVYSMVFWGQQMFLVVARTVGGLQAVSLETMTVDSIQQDSATQQGTYLAPYITHLDRRASEVTCSLIYNPTTNQTEILGPVALNPAAIKVVTRYDPNNPTADVGVNIPVVGYIGNAPVVNGNLTTTKFYIGENYTMRFRFSPLMLREPASQGGPPIGVLNSKTQVRTLTVRASYASYFRLEINPYYRQQYVVPFTGRFFGGSLANLGQLPGMGENIEVRSLIGCNCDQVTIDLVNDTPLPCKISNAEYEVLFYTRAKRS